MWLKIKKWIRALKDCKEYYFFKKEIKKNYQKLEIKFNFKNIGLIKENPEETPDHYQIFTFWVIKELFQKKTKKILDVGGTKILNMINSLNHEVTALVLKGPYEQISNVKWIEHDVSDPLPFPNDYFDIFISPGTLHLIGIGRYGEKKNPKVLLFFLKELKRVLKNESYLYLLLPLGQDQFIYGLHFIYSFNTIQKIFKWIGAEIVDYFVDELVKSGRLFIYNKKNINRFSKNINVNNLNVGEYKIIYLKLLLRK